MCTQSCLTLHSPMDCSPPGSSVHGISQVRILKWVAIYFTKFPYLTPQSVGCILYQPIPFIVKAMVLPGVMYGSERWTIKKAEHRKIDAVELWCRRRLLRVPWTVWQSNLSILKEINPEYSLDGPKLKLQYFSHLMRRTDSLEKTLILEKIEGRRRRGNGG